MPLITTSEATPGLAAPYTAAVIVPAHNARATIGATLESIVASLRDRLARADGNERFAVSVVDDASVDGTAAMVAEFGRNLAGVDLILTVNAVNAGRGCARNRAAAAVVADHYLFLDHDDLYLPEHVNVCLEALARNPRADFVKTRVALSDPVHADWEPRINGSLTQNLCVRAYAHRLVGGFHEEPAVETYGCDDVLYNRLLRRFLWGIDVPVVTVRFVRRPGNSFDRLHERKFSRPWSEAEVTLSPVQKAVAPRVAAIAAERARSVEARVARLRRISGAWRAPGRRR